MSLISQRVPCPKIDLCQCVVLIIKVSGNCSLVMEAIKLSPSAAAACRQLTNDRPTKLGLTQEKSRERNIFS